MPHDKPDRDPLYIEIHIEGEPQRKSNNRRILTNRKTGKPFVAKSEEALAWVRDAIRQITGDKKQKVGSRDQRLCISFWVRYGSYRPDLSTELITDMLQKAKVIADDRWVFEKHEYKYIDRDNPGVDIVIEEQEALREPDPVDWQDLRSELKRTDLLANKKKERSE